MKLNGRISENCYEDVIRALKEINPKYSRVFLDNTDTSYNYVLEQMGMDQRGTYKLNLELEKEDVKKIIEYCEEAIETPFVVEEGDEDYADVFFKEFEKRKYAFEELLVIMKSFK